MKKKIKIKAGILDSKNIHSVVAQLNKSYTKFSTGAIRDSQEGKVDFTETISWTAFNRYAHYMTGKKAKYGSGNFKKGIPISSYEQSLLRHIDKYMRNKYEGGQDETDQDHLSAIVFNTFGIMHQEEMEKLSTHKKL